MRPGAPAGPPRAAGPGRATLERPPAAGSLPPQQESYQTSGLAGLELLQPLYQRTADALAPHVDLLLCETLSSIEEGLAAASVAAASSKPWWISWTLEDSERALLRSGEVLQARPAYCGGAARRLTVRVAAPHLAPRA